MDQSVQHDVEHQLISEQMTKMQSDINSYNQEANRLKNQLAQMQQADAVVVE